MAVTTQYSTEYTSVFQSATPSLLPTSTWDGRVRGQFFACTQDGAGDATSSFAITKAATGNHTAHRADVFLLRELDHGKRNA
jgi:hypothetical protein